MNESDIDRLLREQTPEVPIPAGLEMRIRASLRTAPRRRFAFAWVGVPAAAAIVLALVLAPRKPAGTAVSRPPVEVPAIELSARPAVPTNPLGEEARAIRHDAERTGRFLLDCFPTLSAANR